jgi:hypothetical protein
LLDFLEYASYFSEFLKDGPGRILVVGGCDVTGSGRFSATEGRNEACTGGDQQTKTGQSSGNAYLNVHFSARSSAAGDYSANGDYYGWADRILEYPKNAKSSLQSLPGLRCASPRACARGDTKLSDGLPAAGF